MKNSCDAKSSQPGSGLVKPKLTTVSLPDTVHNNAICHLVCLSIRLYVHYCVSVITIKAFNLTLLTPLCNTVHHSNYFQPKEQALELVIQGVTSGLLGLCDQQRSLPLIAKRTFFIMSTTYRHRCEVTVFALKVGIRKKSNQVHQECAAPVAWLHQNISINITIGL